VKGSGHQARKRFGQHFLVDTAIIDGIVRAIDPKPGQLMVEIGPGLAALTQPLVERLGRLRVIELDRDLAARLREHPQLQVVQADVLSVQLVDLADLSDSAEGTDGRDSRGVGEEAPEPTSRWRVVGNLPYNISTPILFHLLEQVQWVVDQHFMLQKEVVERMVAPPDSSEYSRLSVMLQWRYAMEEVLSVPPDAFDPPPRVDSAVVRMVPLPAAAQLNVDRFSTMVQVAFSQRRKLLRHTLAPWLEAQGFTGDFDVQRRAQEVSADEYVALAQRLNTSTAAGATGQAALNQ
jgi:16S rRNA (adenine1518-N6/adenine1519-N6)-dimethyltransferase